MEEDKKLKEICDKLTDEEITYLTFVLSAKIIKELGKKIKEQHGQH